MYNLTFGADPEVFATINLNGEYEVISPALLNKFSGMEFITKDYKHPTFIEEKDFIWMMDGVATELTLNKPYQDPFLMKNDLLNSLDSLQEFLSKLSFEGNDLHLYKKPVVKINPERYLPYLEDELIYQGFIFGCDPDKDAILPDYRCQTFKVKDHKLRYGGGHIHLGSNDLEIRKAIKENVHRLVHLMAIGVGNLCISTSVFPEEDKLRVFHYGKPGRFRDDKEYGIEYRTPSNSWLSNLDILPQIFETCNKCIYYLLREKEGLEKTIQLLPKTIESITTANQDLAENLYKEFME